MTATLYGNFLVDLFNGVHDFSTNTFNVILCTSSYNAQSSDHYLADVNTNEVENGNGYTTGGTTITITSVAYANNELTIQADSPTPWTESTITARYAIIYNYTVSGNPLVGYFDFGEDKESSNGTFELDVNSAGLINVTP